MCDCNAAIRGRWRRIRASMRPARSVKWNCNAAVLRAPAAIRTSRRDTPLIRRTPKRRSAASRRSFRVRSPCSVTGGDRSVRALSGAERAAVGWFSRGMARSSADRRVPGRGHDRYTRSLRSRNDEICVENRSVVAFVAFRNAVRSVDVPRTKCVPDVAVQVGPCGPLVAPR